MGVKMGCGPWTNPLACQNEIGRVRIFNLPARFGPAHLARKIGRPKAGQPTPCPLTCFVFYFLFFKLKIKKK